MKTPKIHEVITPDLIQAARAYLLARANAETIREECDQVQRQILSERDYFPRREFRDRPKTEPIREPKHTYLMDDIPFKQYHDEYQLRIRRGGKWNDLPDEHCPALVAEELQRQAERLIVELSAPKFGTTADAILSSRNGLENWQKWIDLHVQMCIQSPMWEDPMKMLKRA